MLFHLKGLTCGTISVTDQYHTMGKEDLYVLKSNKLVYNLSKKRNDLFSSSATLYAFDSYC